MPEFDIVKIFLGEVGQWKSVLEILFRTAFMFFWTMINIRFLSKRNLGELTSFELLVYLALGSAAGDPMLYPAIPLVFGMAVITGIVIIEKILSILSQKSTAIDKVVEGKPALLMRKGQILEENLAKNKVSKKLLMSHLRQHNIENTREVKYAYLETSGSISVIKFDKKPKTGGLSTLYI